MSRKYIVIEELGDDGIFCLGIFNKYVTALGTIMNSVFEFKQSYKKEGDIFRYTEMYEMEGDSGEAMEVTFKANCWEKERKYYYYILFYDKE